MALRQSIEVIPSLRRHLADSRASLLQTLAENLDELEDIRSLISGAIADDPPATAGEPGMIRDGFNAELDELRNLARSGKSYITAIEARERGRTGISSLKVKFNNVFGYFIEISNANKDRVPKPITSASRRWSIQSDIRLPNSKSTRRRCSARKSGFLNSKIQIFTELRNRSPRRFGGFREWRAPSRCSTRSRRWPKSRPTKLCSAEAARRR